jgi:hypothetical protein
MGEVNIYWHKPALDRLGLTEESVVKDTVIAGVSDDYAEMHGRYAIIEDTDTGPVFPGSEEVRDVSDVGYFVGLDKHITTLRIDASKLETLLDDFGVSTFEGLRGKRVTTYRIGETPVGISVYNEQK